MRILTAGSLLFALASSLVAAPGFAAVSIGSVASPAGGNGHNVSFDGRLYLVTRGGPAGIGWHAAVLRPLAVGTGGALPDVSNAFSPWELVQLSTNNENGVALCEETPQPQRCDGAGTLTASGDHACYDMVVFDSDAIVVKPNNVMRRRKLKVIVANPGTASAAVAASSWTDAALTPLSPALRGIEPSVTKDGRLLVWQGRPNNSGEIDTMVYSYNPVGCALSGWSLPKSIAAMNTDPNIVGKYKLAERPLRAADGTVFAPGALVYGGYPWIFPSGEALNFTAVNMPCRAPEDPAGCGPRRNALSVLGYVTNWTLSHIDGDANPANDDFVRLFFTSPGPNAASPLPFTKGLDVWPFFGSNTANYTELVFDDALDGNYAAYWHMNELVNAAGNFDFGGTADSSGYANTGRLRGGASFPAKNNGRTGKAIVFNGTDARVEVAHAASLLAVNQITIEMTLRPTSEPNCDANNNYRVLLAKGAVGQGSYSIVFQDDHSFQARVRVAGNVQLMIPSMATLPLDAWSKIAVEYDAATGTMATLVDGVETNRLTFPSALLSGQDELLTIGGPSGARAACPNMDGAFAGLIDEVAISRVWRHGALPPAPDMATDPPLDLSAALGDAGVPGQPEGSAGSGTPSGGDLHSEDGCSVSRGHIPAPAASLTLLALVLLMLSRHRAALRRPCQSSSRHSRTRTRC